MRGQELKTQYLKNVPLSNLVLWKRNPHDISPEAFTHLKNKIKELGVFKPLLAVKGEGDTLRVIGGNQRLNVVGTGSIIAPKQFNAQKLGKVEVCDLTDNSPDKV
jgi:hypothetical protein